jgi:hypothetical protein
MNSNANNLGKTVTAAICALLFSATMVLSAVGPAEAKARDAAIGIDGHQTPKAAAYLA